MSLQKRAHWTETIDGVTYDEDVDIYTSAKAVLYEDGTNLEDNLPNYASGELVGNLDNLTTTDKSSLANAIDEVKSVNDSHVESLESMSGGSKVFWLERYPLEWVNTEVSTLPYEVRYSGVVVYNNEIHILGSAENYTAHYKWNGFTWSSVSNLPYNFYWDCAVVLDNHIHILGGNSSGDSKYHYKWNGSSWSSVSTLPYDFFQGHTIVLDGEIHIMGANGGGGSKYHYKYNGSIWESVSTLPYDILNGGAIVYDNQIHILGGNSSSNRKKHYKWNGSSWESVSTLPYDYYVSDTVICNNEIHILGGNANSTYYKYHYKYNGSTWESISTLPCDFAYGSIAVVYQGAIHILGGGTSGYKSHYTLNTPPTISGYVKKDFTVYLPIPSTPITNNLQATDEGFLVTDSGYVEIAVG